MATGGWQDDMMVISRDNPEYLNLHEVTICKYAAQGKIPAIRIGRLWRFDKDVIDRWIKAF